MIRILIADDHTVLREALVTTLRASGDCIVVAEAGDGISAIEQAHAVRPDIAVVDISMPRLNGIEVVRRLTTGSFPVFQLDATAYPGSSGSPLYDAETGVVIGIVNMVLVKGTKESALSQPSGITYAVPSRHLKSLIDRAR